MSRRPLDPDSSGDLQSLARDGYAVTVTDGYLVIDDVPFATAERSVVRGSLMCPLDTQGGVTSPPSTHVMWFSHLPHDKDGNELSMLVHERGPLPLVGDLVAACSSSVKVGGENYPDYHAKVTAYARLLLGHAQAIDPTATAVTHRPSEVTATDSPFVYMDTNASRGNFAKLSERLALGSIAVVGMGGTGAYLLDFLARTPARQIHLYDADVFSTHNACRSPGAASIDVLDTRPLKVDYHQSNYSKIHSGIHAHPTRVTAENLTELLAMDFVFLAMDTSEDKRDIIAALTDGGVPFVDTGLGIRHEGDHLAGLLRATASFPAANEHIARDGLISYALGPDAEYEANIQVAELNALAAILAVMAFKRHLGFYADAESGLHTLYRIDSNELINMYGDDDDIEEVSNSGDAP